MRRVVITGYGVVAPLGRTVPEVLAALRAGACGTQRMPDWNRYGELACQVGRQRRCATRS